MKAIFVPTLDSEVQMQVGPVLRSRYGFSFVRAANPFVYSEKVRADRRERLRSVLDYKSVSDEDIAAQREILGLKDESGDKTEVQRESVYERASEALIAARRIIFQYSIQR